MVDLNVLFRTSENCYYFIKETGELPRTRTKLDRQIALHLLMNQNSLDKVLVQRLLPYPTLASGVPAKFELAFFPAAPKSFTTTTTISCLYSRLFPRLLLRAARSLFETAWYA